ncbi:hypothetical protein SuNHUV7_34720 (plasmid) [Pseudoseohaeicola sp. NH-UV-7]
MVWTKAVTKKKGTRRSPESFAVQALFVNRSVFFCLRPERRYGRAHPPGVKVGGRIVPPHPILVAEKLVLLL